MFLNKILGSFNHFRTISSSAKIKYTNVLMENGIKTITLCHTKTRNALSINMMETLIENITTEKDNPDMRVIVIRHEGPVFSSGHNLRELSKEEEKEQHRNVFILASTLMRSVIESPVPVIARINGVAAAAGCQLVAQCDLAVCTKDSSFSTPGANFGIFCSTPGVALSRCVGRKNALHMLLTGLPVKAEDALRIGLVNKVSDTSDVLDKELNIICDAISSKSRLVIKNGKRFFYEQSTLGDINEAYKRGAEVMSTSCSMQPGQHGIDCFIKKQKPVWTQ